MAWMLTLRPAYSVRGDGGFHRLTDGVAGVTGGELSHGALRPATAAAWFDAAVAAAEASPFPLPPDFFVHMFIVLTPSAFGSD